MAASAEVKLDMAVPGAFAMKCKCCNNPWQQVHAQTAGGDEKAPESAGRTEILACDDCGGLEIKNLDPTVSPRENFYLYSVGGWKAANPIPDEYPSWNTFLQLHGE